MPTDIGLPIRQSTTVSPRFNDSVAIVGLGYVGLPLALSFGTCMRTIGFDLSESKISSYKLHRDPTGETDETQFLAAMHFNPTSSPGEISEADVVIVAVPTPVDAALLPDFGPLLSACRTIAPFLKQEAIVVFESTVYPGATEEICIPEIERVSNKKWKTDFFVGYSPERINPGDREHTLSKIVKVVSGDTPQTLERVSELYKRVVGAGIYRASSIRVAEAAKVIENTQRDLNIALMNELAIIFHRMGIDTTDVLEAAGTKWNFLRFKPGLVGGHCIGVDPYYLTHAAEKLGHHPQVILAGRRINDRMGKYIAEQTVKSLVARNRPINGAKVAILGLAFKEDCSDLRNSKVADVIDELRTYGVRVLVHDPRINAADAKHEYGVDLCSWDDLPPCDALILAVAHREFVEMPLEKLTSKVQPSGCVVDVKSRLDKDRVQALGFSLWRL